jgi:hypothetical protein
MANKLSVGLAISLLLSGSFSSLALADDATSALEKQIMNGDAAPSAGNPDNFPWMNKDGTVKPSTNPGSAIITPAATPAVSSPPPPVRSEPIPPPPSEVNKSPIIHPEAVREEKLKVEHAEVERAPHERTVTFEKEKTVEARTAEEKPGEVKKTTMLYGRIEQLTASAGASFPSLKAQTPMMDPRGVLAGKATANGGSPLLGSILKSFPVNFQGNWGGRLVLQTVQVDPNYYRVDPEEARRTVQAMKPGNIGQVNFMFERSRGAISLEPAKCLFMVPASDTQAPEQIKKMLGAGGGNSAFGGMMSQMMSTMPVALILEFGDYQTSVGETTVAGNQQRQIVLKNETRQLAPNVLEQQIVTQTTTWDKRTNRPRTGYGESVLKFTRQSPTVLYVQAATVNYGADKKFLEKMVLYGSIGKGVVMNTDPMQAMQSSVPGMSGMGGLQNMFGGGGAGGAQIPGQIPGMPAGGLDGMLKNLFGGQ